MQRNEEEAKLTYQHVTIWNTLRALNDGERIRGQHLRDLTGVNLRNFYVLIEELQAAGCFVGASRNDDQGYYEIRTNADMDKYLKKKRKELLRKSVALDEFEQMWNERKIVQEVDDDGPEK